MNTNTTNTTNTTATKTHKTRPEGYTKYDWDVKTLRVFNGLVKLAEKSITVQQFVNHPVVKELMDKCCGAKNPEDRYPLFVSLLVSSMNYTTVNGEKVMKIKSVGTVRQWFNGGYAERMARPVIYKEVKEPVKKAAKKATKKEVKKVKNVSVDQWVKGLTDLQKDELKVALAMAEMVA